MRFILKNTYGVISILYVILVLCFVKLPVFWDMYGQVKTAHYFIETNFRDLFPNGHAFSDNGHFPLYPLYLAGLFKIFGFTLITAHLSVLPFLLGILWQLQKLCKSFLTNTQTFVTMLLTLTLPAFVSQTIYFSSEIAFAFSSLWMINSLKNNRASHITMASVLLCLLNIRGIAFVLIFFGYFRLRKKEKNATYLVPGFIIWGAWMFFHYKISGWLFQNPENLEHRTLAGFNAQLKNLFWCFWKVLDLGSVVGFAIISAVCIKNKKVAEPFIWLLFSVVSVFIICIPLSNPVSNRYFLICNLLLLPAVIYYIAPFKKQIKATITVVFGLILFSANWFCYPNKYSNPWDCTLQSTSYFDLRKELDDFVKEHTIAPKDVAAGFQLYFNDAFYLMDGSYKEYTLLSDTEMNTELYIADSNICNNYNADREKYLKENYYPLKLFKKGCVYITLYRRKNSK